MIDTQKVQASLREFADTRDWNQYHDPKNLVMALSVECSELVEIFQWLTSEESKNIMATDKAELVRDELADITNYVLRICDLLNVDLSQAIEAKLIKNNEKYPIHLSRGNAKKYTEF